MDTNPRRRRDPDATRQRILDAARDLMLRQGFAATGVGGICAAARVTKGALFHHFESKEALGVAALSDWAAASTRAYAAANDPAVDPLDRVHRFFDVMAGFVHGATGPVSCLMGMMAQESAGSCEAIREPTSGHLQAWTDCLREILDDVQAERPPRVPFDSEEVAWFINSLWQGSMLVAKARQDSEIILRNLEHARAYAVNLFSAAPAPVRPGQHPTR